MPKHFIKKVADVCNISMDYADELWVQAKELALESGQKEDHPAFYAYVTGIFKKSLGSICSTKLTANKEADKPTKVTRPTSESFPATYSDSPTGRILRLLDEAEAIELTSAGQPEDKVSKPETKGAENKTTAATDTEAQDPANQTPAKKKPDNKDTMSDAETKEPVSDADGKLANDLAELYQEMMNRWSKLVGDDEQTEAVVWSKDNPYATLSPPIREVLQAGAALHYDELTEVRKVAERAMREWQITQPQLVSELAKIQALPKMHRKALEPLLTELVKRGLLPELVLTYLETDVTVGTLDWLNAFPSLLAANANNVTNISDTTSTVVLETLMECLLYNTNDSA
jgi:hypothetical protein